MGEREIVRLLFHLTSRYELDSGLWGSMHRDQDHRQNCLALELLDAPLGVSLNPHLSAVLASVFVIAPPHHPTVVLCGAFFRALDQKTTGAPARCARLGCFEKKGLTVVYYQATMSSFVGRFFTTLLHQSLEKSSNHAALQRPSVMTTIFARTKHTAKTHSGIKKRFRLRANGSLKRSKAGRQHNTGYKSRSRVNRLGQTGGIKNPHVERKLKMCLGALGSN